MMPDLLGYYEMEQEMRSLRIREAWATKMIQAGSSDLSCRMLTCGNGVNGSLGDLGLQRSGEERKRRARSRGRFLKVKGAVWMAWSSMNGEHPAAALPGGVVPRGRRLTEEREVLLLFHKLIEYKEKDRRGFTRT